MALDPGPAVDAQAIIENDTAIVGARALYIGTSGDVVIDTDAHQNVTFKSVPIGWFPVRVLRLKVATTAADIVALY